MTGTICIDWGSTNLRAFLVVDGQIRDRRQSSQGVKSLNGPDAFEAVFEQITDGWRSGVSRALLSGMVTSRNGWVETPYLPLPAVLPDLLNHAVRRQRGALDLLFLPGLAQTDPPDVIRGEECQLLGVSEGKDRRIVVAPGTHSKWVELDGDVVVGFRTIMTGELYDLVRHHSLAGRLAMGDDLDADAVCLGVDTAQQGTLVSSLFQARSKVLLNGYSPEKVASFLSGLLIGTELREARQMFDLADADVTLIATHTVGPAYHVAMEHLGIAVSRVVDDATERGYLRLMTRDRVPVDCH